MQETASTHRIVRRTVKGKDMRTEKFDLWESTPGHCDEVPTLTVYIPDNKTHDSAIVILPGGGYYMRAEHEGDGYARFLAEHGYTAFVCDYRVRTHLFPLPLLDSRRAVRTARHFADKYGIDKNKIAIMGSSAGGHLAALTSTYYENIEFEGLDEIDGEDFIPNAQILCYPVIKLLGKGISHLGSGHWLLGERHAELGEELSPDNIVSERTPPAFIWHTFEDGTVNVINSLDYLKALKNKGRSAECHIYPHGHHGLGLSTGDDAVQKHVSDWSRELLSWLEYIGF